MTEHPSGDFLTARQVRARFGGVSNMWLHRRIHSDGFPKPVRFGARVRFFRLTDVEAWERAMIARGVKNTQSVG